MSRLVSSETHSTVSMGSNNIVFVVSLTVVSLAWIYVFQLYVFKVVEQKTRISIKSSYQSSLENSMFSK